MHLDAVHPVESTEYRSRLLTADDPEQESWIADN